VLSYICRVIIFFIYRERDRDRDISYRSIGHSRVYTVYCVGVERLRLRADHGG